MRAPGGEQTDLRVEGFVLDQGDVLGGRARGQVLTLLGSEVNHLLLQGGGELLAGAVRGGDDPVELTQAQEQAQQPQPGAALEREDQVGSDHQAVQEGEPRGAVEEAGDARVEVEAALSAEPVLQGGTGHAGLLGELTLGGGRSARVVEVVEDLGGVDAVPAERLWPGCVVGGSLRGSHGSSPCG